MARSEKAETEARNHTTTGNSLSGRVPKRRIATFTQWSTAIALRLFIWYTLLTAVFRCPSDPEQLDGFSPRVCGPYLAARSHVDPYIAPYYQAYAAPYIEAVQPYVHNFHRNIYVPSKTFTVRTYRIYGAPRLDQGLEFLQERWSRIVTPILHSARGFVIRSYKSSLQPHLTKTKALVVPRYQAAANSVALVRDTYFSPYYSQLEPVVSKALDIFSEFFANEAFPLAQKLWFMAVDFFNGTLRSRVARLYLENVEPQLIRIGKKLREGKQTQWPVDEIERPVNDTPTKDTKDHTDQDAFEKGTEAIGGTARESTHESGDHPYPTSSFSGPIAIDIPTSSPDTSEFQANGKPSTTLQRPSQHNSVSEKVANDLRLWQEKFAIAADNGCQDLEEQVVNIVRHFTDNGYRAKGEESVQALEAAAQHEINLVKARIIDIVQSLPEDPSPDDQDAAYSQLLHTLRSSGSAIREPAHALREWFSDYEEHLDRQVKDAVTSTLEILDSIRELGLQEIGMRLAWMDGVTYKDWAKFHALKRQLSEWRDGISDFAMQHQAFLDAKAIGNDILSRGMVAAESVAGELARLKEVAKWKIQAGDSSDDFKIRTDDPAEFRANKKAALERERAKAAARVAENADIDNPGNEDTDSPAPTLIENSTDGQLAANSIKGESFDSTGPAPEATDGDTGGKELSISQDNLDSTGSHSENTASAVVEELIEADPNLQNPTEDLEPRLGEESSSDEPAGSFAFDDHVIEKNSANAQESPSTLSASASSDPNLGTILSAASAKLQAAIDVAYNDVIESYHPSQSDGDTVVERAAAYVEDIISSAQNQLDSVFHAGPQDPDAPRESKLQSANEQLLSISNEARTQLEQLSTRFYYEAGESSAAANTFGQSATSAEEEA
ncbi:hypothetical protein VTO42DRAFT_6263 [Malbranchea cinnamomea]